METISTSKIVTSVQKFVSLQEISQSSLISYQTLNYYTSLGLLKSQKRQGNKRLYAVQETQERLKKITELKNQGYPLRIISNILNHSEDVKNVSL